MREGSASKAEPPRKRGARGLDCSCMYSTFHRAPRVRNGCLACLPLSLSLPLHLFVSLYLSTAVRRRCRFKGDKNKGPAKQRVRDDSAKPQISEVKETATATKGGSKAGSSATNGSSRGGLGIPAALKGKGSSGQAAPTLPVTSLTSTTTVRFAI